MNEGRFAVLQHVFDYVFTHWTSILGELLVFAGGMILGILLISARTVRHLQKIYISPNFKDAEWNLARFHDKKGNEYVYINPKGYLQTAEAWFVYHWWTLSGRKQDYFISNPSKQRSLVTAVVFLLAFLAVFELYNVFDVRPLNTHVIETLLD